MNTIHEKDSVFQAFSDVDKQKVPNAFFSHANVVMISRDAYYRMTDILTHFAEKYPEEYRQAWEDIS